MSDEKVIEQAVDESIFLTYGLVAAIYDGEGNPTGRRYERALMRKSGDFA